MRQVTSSLVRSMMNCALNIAGSSTVYSRHPRTAQIPGRVALLSVGLRCGVGMPILLCCGGTSTVLCSALLSTAVELCSYCCLLLVATFVPLGLFYTIPSVPHRGEVGYALVHSK